MSENESEYTSSLSLKESDEHKRAALVQSIKRNKQSQERILALSKHFKKYTKALNETTVYNNDVSKINFQILPPFKTQKIDRNKLETIK